MWGGGGSCRERRGFTCTHMYQRNQAISKDSMGRQLVSDEESVNTFIKDMFEVHARVRGVGGVLGGGGGLYRYSLEKSSSVTMHMEPLQPLQSKTQRRKHSSNHQPIILDK